MGGTEHPIASISTNRNSVIDTGLANSKADMAPMTIHVDDLASNFVIGGMSHTFGGRSLVDVEEQRWKDSAEEYLAMTNQFHEHWQSPKRPETGIVQHAADGGFAAPRLQAAAWGGPFQGSPSFHTTSAPPGIFFVHSAAQQAQEAVTASQNGSNGRIEEKRRAPKGRAVHQGMGARTRHHQANAKAQQEKLDKVLAKIRSSGKACDLVFADVRPHVLDLAVDKDGVPFLLLQCTESEATVSEVCQAVAPETRKISADEFGKDLMQGLLALAPLEQQRSLTAHLKGNMKQLSCDVHGCRVVQKAFEVMPFELGSMLLEGLKDCIDSCMKNIHGNHVIQMCIVQMPPDSVSFIAKAIADWGVHKAGVHQYGCRVLMRLLEYCEMQPPVEEIRQSLMNNVRALSQDRYGNYAVQRLLEDGSMADKRRIIMDLIEEDVLELATHKYAHNVILKCAEISQDVMVKALLSSPMEDLVTQRFGAAVVERMFELCSLSNRELLRQHIMDVPPMFKENEYVAHLCAKLDISPAAKM